jgi:hypothetical protein
MVIDLSDPFLIFPKEPGHPFFDVQNLHHARFKIPVFFLSIEKRKWLFRLK